MDQHMYGDWNSAWDWLWVTLMMFFWIVVIGAVVYAAVRLAADHDHQPKRRPVRDHAEPTGGTR